MISDDAIERPHRLTGMPADEIVRCGLVRKEIPIYGLAAVATPYPWGGLQLGEGDSSTPTLRAECNVQSPTMLPSAKRRETKALARQLSVRDQLMEEEQGPAGCGRVVSEAASLACWAPLRLAVRATSR